jgi:hypothetical protein
MARNAAALPVVSFVLLVAAAGYYKPPNPGTRLRLKKILGFSKYLSGTPETP